MVGPVLLALVAATVPPASAQERRPAYVALGDSYSAGEGVGPYEPGTDTVENRCHRGNGAFPKIFAGGATGTGYDLTFAACGGARARHVTSDEQYAGDQPGGQVGALGRLGESRPGDVVSITIGGNDARFGEIVRACVVGLLPCFLLYADEAEWIEQIVRPRLRQTYAALRAGAPAARIFAVTYPQIFQTDRECARDLGISRREKSWIRERTAQLNRVVAEEAGRAGLDAVDAADVFAGHEICTGEPWVFGFFEGDGAFHPDVEGHGALASRFAAAVGWVAPITAEPFIKQ